MALAIEEIIETMVRMESKTQHSLIDISEALRDANERNPYLIEKFLETLFSAAKIIEPWAAEDDLRTKACSGLAALAYIADWRPNEFNEQKVRNAYNNREEYGEVMKYTRRLLKAWEMDISPNLSNNLHPPFSVN